MLREDDVALQRAVECGGVVRGGVVVGEGPRTAAADVVLRVLLHLREREHGFVRALEDVLV